MATTSGRMANVPVLPKPTDTEITTSNAPATTTMASSTPLSNNLAPNNTKLSSSLANDHATNSSNPSSALASMATDPLLSLTPDETLAALRATDLVPTRLAEQHNDAITRGIAHASTTERALGVRSAAAASQARAWCAELTGWTWPGRFAADDGSKLDEGLATEGSLSSALVEQRTARLEAIRDSLDAWDLDELKDFVRSRHLLPSSRASSLYELDLSAPTVAQHLDDFTALISGTILMALPYIHRLNRLLNLWDIRLRVLYQVPFFLDHLWSSRTAVDAAWNAITPDGPERPELSRGAYDTMQGVLGERVTQLARTIDSMLDMLEGHQDTLPDDWIDRMEAVQEDFEAWVVVAERLAEEDAWREREEVRSGRERQALDIQEKEQLKTFNDKSRDVSPTAGAKKGVPTELSTAAGYGAMGVTMAAAPLLPPPRSPLQDPSADLRKDAQVQASKTALPSNNTAHPAAYVAARTADAIHSSTSTISNTSSGAKASNGSALQTPRRPPAPLRVSSYGQTSNRSISPHSATSSSFASDFSEGQILDASPIQLYSPTKATRPHELLHSPSHGAMLPEALLSTYGGRERPDSPTSPTRGKMQQDNFVRRDSEQTERSFSTLRGSVDLGDSKEISRTGSSVDQLAATAAEMPLVNRVRNIILKRNESNPSAKSSIQRKIPEDAEAEAKANATPPRTAEEETSEYDDDESYIEPTHEPRTLEEQLANRIRSILTHIPGRIRLQSSSDSPQSRTASAQGPSSRATSGPGLSTSTGPTIHPPPRRSAPSFTLAPAFGQKATPKVQAGNSEIKVYHLQAPDRVQPIKLYVRLVGDEERVMVRVGGGWADLGDYLKEYAVHHGHRSASGATDVAVAEFQTGTPPKASTTGHPGSSPANATSRGVAEISPPALAPRKVRGPQSSVLAVAPPLTPDSVVQRRTDALAPGRSVSSSGGGAVGGVEYIGGGLPTLAVDPDTSNGNGASSSSASVPASHTVNAASPRAGDTTPTPDDDDAAVGLGGVRRTVELSPTKQAWVEGMLQQATRATSGEQRLAPGGPQGQKGFGELGKAGGTRRLFMRGGKDKREE